MINFRAFPTKHIYDEHIKINYILSYILYPVFETVVMDFLASFNSKCYYNKFEFYNIFNLLFCNIFSVFEVVSIPYKLGIGSLFFDKAET